MDTLDPPHLGDSNGKPRSIFRAKIRKIMYTPVHPSFIQVLNTLKTKVMLITSRQKRNNIYESALSLKYNDIDIKMTTSDNILGVHVDENLS